MHIVVLTTDYKLQIIKEEDLESVRMIVKQELTKGPKSTCEKYIEDLGYTGPIWDNCSKSQ